MNQENTTKSKGPKVEYSQEEVQRKLDASKGYEKCKLCWETVGLRKAADKGQFFFLCRPCYDKEVSRGMIVPLAKEPNKKEKKALKKQRVRELKGLV